MDRRVLYALVVAFLLCAWRKKGTAAAGVCAAQGPSGPAPATQVGAAVTATAPTRSTYEAVTTYYQSKPAAALTPAPPPQVNVTRPVAVDVVGPVWKPSAPTTVPFTDWNLPYVPYPPKTDPIAPPVELAPAPASVAIDAYLGGSWGAPLWNPLAETPTAEAVWTQPQQEENVEVHPMAGSYGTWEPEPAPLEEWNYYGYGSISSDVYTEPQPEQPSEPVKDELYWRSAF